MKPRQVFLLWSSTLLLFGLACNAVVPTPTPVPTATVQPEPTLTPIPPSATPDTPYLVFKDNFRDPTSGWDRATDETGTTDYVENGYRIHVLGPANMLISTLFRDYADVRIEVNARWIEGDQDNAFGVICRHIDDDNFYSLIITGDGYAAIRRRVAGGPIETLTNDGNFAYTRSLSTIQRTVRISAECVGSRLTLWADDLLILETEDESLTHGDVGLTVSVFEGDSTTVEFSRFDLFVVP